MAQDVLENTLLRLKSLEIKFHDFETDTKMTDCCLNELDADLEEGRDNLEKLQKRVTQLEGHLGKLEDRVEIIDEGDDKRLDLLEERVVVLNTQNTELRSHLNLVIDMVNNITRVLNKTFNNNEPADEAMLQDPTIDTTTPHADNEPADEAIVVDDDDDEPEENEPIQRTLRQVCDMYQSQPMDEEGWEEMTKAIEAAEEYEASLQKQQELSTTVNGLTQDEWNDLLRI